MPAIWFGRPLLLLRLTAVGCFMILVVLTMSVLFGVARDMRRLAVGRALDSRGLTTMAEVGSATYDPDGGDPDGWTIDHVRFTTQSGEIVSAVIGHHGPPTAELQTHRLAVVYDPVRPAVVEPAGKYPGDAGSEGRLIQVVLGTLLAVGAIAGMVILTPRVPSLLLDQALGRHHRDD